MAANVKFEDFSFKVKAAINDSVVAWLYEVSGEIASQAKRNCKTDDDVGKQLAGSYKNAVDESAGEAQVGSHLEASYWEEWGTGSYAVHGDGRKGWWVYVSGSTGGHGGKSYDKEDDAKKAAAGLRSQGLDAHYTKGKKPNYTLGKSFASVKEKEKERLASILKEGTK